MDRKEFKIIMANPPWEVKGYGSRSNTRWPFVRQDKVLPFPIYQGYAAAVLREAGFTARIIDAVGEELNIKKFGDRVNRERPNLLVLETSTASIKCDLETARTVKDLIKVMIVLIGPHAGYFHKEMLEYPFIDGVVRGEFEYTLLNLVESMAAGQSLRGIEGLTYRDDGEIVVNPPRPFIEPLDQLPFPARDLFDLNLYDKFPGREKGNITMISSRGCPYRCTFCLWPQVMYGHRYRQRSAANVADEIEEVIEKYNATNIFFDDDIFALNEGKVFDFCDELDRRNIYIPWQCYGRCNMASLKLFRRMKEAGCHMIRFGIESGNQAVLDRARKGVSLEEIKRAFSLARQAELKTFGTVMLGLPGETKETMAETIKFLIALDPTFIQLSIVTPYPGTELFSYLEKKGYLLTRDWSRYNGSSQATFQFPGLSQRDMEAGIRRGWRRFYLRPSKVFQQLKRLRDWDSLVRLFRGFKTVVRGHF